jgi:hypothetical protein
MSNPLRCLVLVAGVIVASGSIAAADKPRSETVSLHVSVDAAGKVQAMEPSDAKVTPALLGAAEGYARRLTFTPARKNGVAVNSETTLTLVLALEPRADGQYGLHLKRATNGPGVLEVGKTVAPTNQQAKENGALAVVGVSLLADGTADMSTLTTERMELRVPSEFAEVRYMDSIKMSLRGSRFELDKVDGVSIPAHVSIPYRFGAGPAKSKPGDDERERRHAMEELEAPSVNAVSSVPGIELAKIDYRAPEPAEPAK